jgi:membrane associated rhomboid family serine protease
VARSFQKPLPEPRPGESPINAVPPVVLVLFLLIAGIEIVLSLGGNGLGGPEAIGWRQAAIQRWGFSPALWDHLAQRGFADVQFLPNFVTYAFLHGSVVHALFAGALLLALGKFVGEQMGQARVLAVFLAASVVGAAVYGATVGSNLALFGAYPGVYGLIGAFTYLLWLRLGRMGENRLQAFRLIGVLLAIQLLFGLLFGGSPHWVADVAGFAGGGAAAVLLAPGGLAALRARLRAR